MMKLKRIRYANQVVSRATLEEVLREDALYQSFVKQAEESRAAIKGAEVERRELSHQSTLATPEEREASRLERAVVYARKRLKELKEQRDRQRGIAYRSRVRLNGRNRRMVSASMISMKQRQGELRQALDSLEKRRVKVYRKLYQENFLETLKRADEVQEEEDEVDEFSDEELGLVPPAEEEKEDEDG